jgi:hypothetical protein
MEMLSFLMISYAVHCAHTIYLYFGKFFPEMLFNMKNEWPVSASQVFRVSDLISTKIQAGAYIGTIGLKSFGNRI